MHRRGGHSYAVVVGEPVLCSSAPAASGGCCDPAQFTVQVVPPATVWETNQGGRPG